MTTLMELDPSGHLGLKAGITASYNFTWSDERLKKNMAEIDTNRLSFLDLKAISYELKNYVGTANSKLNTSTLTNKLALTSNSDSSIVEQEYEGLRINGTFFGFRAQDVQKLYPELVCEDINGNLGVNYIGFIPLIIEKMKLQENKILELEDQLTKVTKKNQELSSSISECCSGKFKRAHVGFDETEVISSLAQNYPNPFDIETRISYTLQSGYTNASINIYDLQGKELLSYNLNDEGIVIINSSELYPGIFIYNLLVDGVEIDSKRMILTK